MSDSADSVPLWCHVRTNSTLHKCQYTHNLGSTLVIGNTYLSWSIRSRVSLMISCCFCWSSSCCFSTFSLFSAAHCSTCDTLWSYLINFSEVLLTSSLNFVKSARYLRRFCFFSSTASLIILFLSLYCLILECCNLKFDRLDALN